MVVLAGMVCGYFAVITHECCDRELSPVKLINHLLRADRFLRAVANNKFEEFLENIRKELPRRFCKDKRLLKTMRGMVKNNESYYGCAA